MDLAQLQASVGKFDVATTLADSAVLNAQETPTFASSWSGFSSPKATCNAPTPNWQSFGRTFSRMLRCWRLRVGWRSEQGSDNRPPVL